MKLRQRHILCALALTSALGFASQAQACSSTVVQPGLNITDYPIIVQPGKSCGIRLNLEGWEVHRVSLVEKPNRGSVVIEGQRRYVYTAGMSAGQDRFVIEVETTAYDWQSGAKLQRTTWRITRPVEIR